MFYKETAQYINWLVGDEYLYFDTAVANKITPHTHPFYVWGACVSPDGTIYVMDSDQQWHELEEKDSNSHLISSLHQRVRYMVQRNRTEQERRMAI